MFMDRQIVMKGLIRSKNESFENSRYEGKQLSLNVYNAESQLILKKDLPFTKRRANEMRIPHPTKMPVLVVLTGDDTYFEKEITNRGKTPAVEP